MQNLKSAAIRILLILAVCTALPSCFSQASFDEHAEMRRQRLLEMYPVQKTTQKDVEARWNYPPGVRATRPARGWDSHADDRVKAYATKAEKRIGKKITTAERYYGVDGLFSLCYCWFFYDKSDRLLDAEWQWSSD